MASARGPSDPQVDSTPLSGEAPKAGEKLAILRELEAEAAVFASVPPGCEREELLESHRRRIQHLLHGQAAPRELASASECTETVDPPRPMTAPSTSAGGSPAAELGQAPRARFSMEDLRSTAGRRRLDPRQLRRTAWLSGAAVAIVAAGLLLVTQRERLAGTGRSLVALGRSWLNRPIAQPGADAPPTAPARDPSAPVQVVSKPPRRPGATAAVPLPPLLGARTATGAAARGALRAPEADALARLIGQVGRGAGGRPGESSRPVSQSELRFGSSRFLVSTLRDAAGVALWVDGPRARMKIAYGELAAWFTARYGSPKDTSESSAPEEWRATARWTTPDAVVDLRGNVNSLGDVRVWAVDLRRGGVEAVEDAEVVLTYRLLAPAQR
jgi:hypothetical protein